MESCRTMSLPRSTLWLWSLCVGSWPLSLACIWGTSDASIAGGSLVTRYVSLCFEKEKRNLYVFPGEIWWEDTSQMDRTPSTNLWNDPVCLEKHWGFYGGPGSTTLSPLYGADDPSGAGGHGERSLLIIVSVEGRGKMMENVDHVRITSSYELHRVTILNLFVTCSRFYKRKRREELWYMSTEMKRRTIQKGTPLS